MLNEEVTPPPLEGLLLAKVVAKSCGPHTTGKGFGRSARPSRPAASSLPSSQARISREPSEAAKASIAGSALSAGSVALIWIVSKFHVALGWRVRYPHGCNRSLSVMQLACHEGGCEQQGQNHMLHPATAECLRFSVSGSEQRCL